METVWNVDWKVGMERLFSVLCWECTRDGFTNSSHSWKVGGIGFLKLRANSSLLLPNLKGSCMYSCFLLTLNIKLFLGNSHILLRIRSSRYLFVVYIGLIWSYCSFSISLEQSYPTRDDRRSNKNVRFCSDFRPISFPQHILRTSLKTKYGVQFTMICGYLYPWL